MSSGKPDAPKMPDTAEDWWVLLAADAPLDPAVAAAFARWRSRPGNAAAYAEVARLWADMDAGLRDPQLRDWLEEAEANPPAPSQRRWLRVWLGAAAALVLLLAAVPAVLWMLAGDPGQAPVQSVWQPLETPRGEVREVALADGSVMHLDTATRTEVDLAGAQQRVIRLLEGRIRLDVAEDPRPLRVHAGPLRIDHIGTVFDVSWSDGAGEVLLREGAVLIRAGDRSQALAPGDRLLVDGTGWRLERLAEAALAGSAGWVSGKVQFDNQPLTEVAEVLTAYGPRTVRVDPQDPAADLRVSGVFQTGRQRAFLDALAHVYPIALGEGDRGEVELRARD